MKRIQAVLLPLLAAAVAWVAAWVGMFDAFVPPQHLSAAKAVVEALPFYALIVFGCYALVSVGSALFNYRDCDEAFDSLQEDIKDARRRLAAKGYKTPAGL